MPENRHRAARLALAAALLVVGVVVGGAAGAPPAAEGKPLPPVAVLWQVDSTPAGPQASHRVTVTVTAREAFTELAVALKPPPGFRLVEGTPAWRGPLARDASQALTVVVLGPGSGRVQVSVRGRTASNVHFFQTVAVDVPEPPEKTKDRVPPVRPEPGPTPGVREYPSP